MEIYKEATENYSEGNQILTDNQYDEIENIIEVITGEAPGFKISDPPVDGKVKLPKFMASQTKVKNNKEFLRWYQNNSFNNNTIFNISAKMDGVSLLIDKNKLYTRGNGEFGQDVTWLKDEMKLNDSPPDIMIRGELIISKDNWELLKDSTEVTNPLSFVSGFVNSKTPDLDFIKYLDFVGFQWIDKQNKIELSPSEQFNLISTNGYLSVQYSLQDSVGWEILQNILDNFRKESKYILDGIILTENIQHPRTDDKNPPYSRAYKDSVTIQSVVTDIEWNISKYGTLTPLIWFEPIILDKKEYKKCTGHNASIIKENNIGIGATITIGIKIIPSFLSIDEYGEDYVFPDDSQMVGKQLIASGGTAETQNIKAIESFMVNMGVPGFKKGNITKIYKSGLKTIDSILRASDIYFMNILGKNNGNTIHKEVQKAYHTSSDEKLFVASGFFPNIAIKKAESLFMQINLTQMLAGKLREVKINGIGEKTIKIIEDGLPDFFTWSLSLPERQNISVSASRVTKSGTPVMMTGPPPDPYTKESFADAYNLRLTASWKEVKYLITNCYSSNTNKMMQAAQKEIPIKTYEDFEKVI